MALGNAAEEAKKKFEKLKKVIKELGDDINDLNLNDTVKDAAAVELALKGANERLREMQADVNSINDSFRKTVNSIKIGNEGLLRAKGSFSRLTSLASDLEYHMKGSNKLSVEQLKLIKEQANQEKRRLERNLKQLIADKSILESEGNQADKIKEIEKAIEVSNNLLQAQNKEFTDLIKSTEILTFKQENLSNAMGLGGVALEGMLGSMDALGMSKLTARLGLNEAKQKMEEMAEELTDGGKIAATIGDRFKIMGAGIASMGSNLSKNLTSAEAIIVEMAAALKIADDGAGDMAKKMNLTYGEALNTRRELGNMAAMSGDVALNTKNLQESYMAVGAALGTNVMLNEKDLTTMTKLVSQAGFQHSELMEIQKLSLSQGKSLEDNTKEILGGAEAYASRRGTIVNEKEVLKEVNKMSASLKLSLGGSADKMSQAVVQAKMFGLTLEQAASMSSSLLQFESSIENELSAELLLGKDLNFEKARQLALNNDIAGAAEEIAKQVGTSADFANMNAIQQEAIAKAAGLTKDELAQSLIDREAMAALNGVEGDTAKERFNNLVKQVGMEEAKKRLGEEGLANQMEQQNVQERFAQATEKLKEIFVQIAEPILAIVSPLMNIVSSILPAISILLQPIVWAFQLVADGINFAVEGAKKLLGVFTGTTKELGFWEGLLGGILLIFGSMKVISYAILGYTKLSTFLTGSLATINKVLEASNARILASKTAETVADGTKIGLGTSLLGILGLQNAARAYGLAQSLTGNTLTAIRAAMEQTILGKLILQGGALLKNVGQYILLTIQAGFRSVAESTILGSLIAQGGAIIKNIAKGAIFLAQAIATSVAQISGSAALSLGATALIALAAGAAAYAFFSSMKDGEIDYSKGPIVSGGFGSVQLDKNDTGFFDKNGIKAGTDLFKKEDKVGINPNNSSPQQQSQPDNTNKQLLEAQNYQNKLQEIGIEQRNQQIRDSKNSPTFVRIN